MSIFNHTIQQRGCPNKTNYNQLCQVHVPHSYTVIPVDIVIIETMWLKTRFLVMFTTGQYFQKFKASVNCNTCCLQSHCCCCYMLLAKLKEVICTGNLFTLWQDIIQQPNMVVTLVQELRHIRGGDRVKHLKQGEANSIHSLKVTSY